MPIVNGIMVTDAAALPTARVISALNLFGVASPAFYIMLGIFVTAEGYWFLGITIVFCLITIGDVKKKIQYNDIGGVDCCKGFFSVLLIGAIMMLVGLLLEMASPTACSIPCWLGWTLDPMLEDGSGEPAHSPGEALREGTLSTLIIPFAVLSLIAFLELTIVVNLGRLKALGNWTGRGQGAMRPRHAPVVDIPGSQWPVRATNASSQYNASTWSYRQVEGPPRVYPRYGDYAGAWAPSASRGSTEWIEIEFAEAVVVGGIQIFETCACGETVIAIRLPLLMIATDRAPPPRPPPRHPTASRAMARHRLRCLPAIRRPLTAAPSPSDLLVRAVNPGAVVAVKLRAEGSEEWHTAWTGPVLRGQLPAAARIFSPNLTPYAPPVRHVRLELNQRAPGSWSEIDTVRLLRQGDGAAALQRAAGGAAVATAVAIAVPVETAPAVGVVHGVVVPSVASVDAGAISVIVGATVDGASVSQAVAAQAAPAGAPSGALPPPDTEASLAEPPLVSLVSILRHELRLTDGSFAAICSAACEQLGVDPQDKSVRQQALECWRLLGSPAPVV